MSLNFISLQHKIMHALIFFLTLDFCFILWVKVSLARILSFLNNIFHNCTSLFRFENVNHFNSILFMPSSNAVHIYVNLLFAFSSKYVLFNAVLLFLLSDTISNSMFSILKLFLCFDMIHVAYYSCCMRDIKFTIENT